GLAGQPMWGFRVSRAQIRHLVADLANMSLERRCKVVGLSPQRADIIVAGVAGVERIMRKLGANVVQGHTRGGGDGLMLADGHHKHSYHLIVNSELPGFERRQLQILANVARYHRGTRPKKRHENFSELSVEDQKRVSELAAILRLALALDRTHQQHVGEVRA